MVPFDLHGGTLRFYVEHEVDVADDKAHTAAYRYVLQADTAHDSLLARWEYLRERPSGYPYALGHVHVQADFAEPLRAGPAGKALSRMHLPTARVALELVLRHVIAEWRCAGQDRWLVQDPRRLAHRLRGAPDGAVSLSPRGSSQIRDRRVVRSTLVRSRERPILRVPWRRCCSSTRIHRSTLASARLRRCRHRSAGDRARLRRARRRRPARRHRAERAAAAHRHHESPATSPRPHPAADHAHGSRAVIASTFVFATSSSGGRVSSPTRSAAVEATALDVTSRFFWSTAPSLSSRRIVSRCPSVSRQALFGGLKCALDVPAAAGAVSLPAHDSRPTSRLSASSKRVRAPRAGRAP